MAKNQEMSAFRRFYRIFRWLVLLALIVVIVLALKSPGDVPPGPDTQKIPEQAREFESKLQQLQEAHSRGDPGVQVEISSEEVNAFFAQSMATRGSAANSRSAPTAETRPASDPKSAETPMKDFRIRLEDDAVIAYFVVDFHGKDLDITISGQPGVSDGYMTFSPTGFKVGSLPIPISLAGSTLEKRLNDPETHDQLKLPDFIGDLRVRNQQLVITGK